LTTIPPVVACLSVLFKGQPWLTAESAKETNTMAIATADTVRVIPPLDASAPAATETATFGMGCFWDPDSRFGSIKGVIRTRVGYAGGTTRNPTYRDIGNHTETIQIDYDPTTISYTELLEIFWDSHRPTGPPWSRQYMSVIFFHSDEQRRLAIEARRHEEARVGATTYTEIVPCSGFYLAEDYHQKFRLNGVPDILHELQRIYPHNGDLIRSTVAARINGYVSGYGTAQRLQAELGSLGLSPAASQRLLDIVRARPGKKPESPLSRRN